LNSGPICRFRSVGDVDRLPLVLEPAGSRQGAWEGVTADQQEEEYKNRFGNPLAKERVR